MATNFPTTLDALTNPSAGNTLNSPSHSTQHANSNDAIEALQTKVGVDSSAVTTSLDYKMRVNNPTGEITIWGTSTAPTGWLICDGSAVSRSTYSALFGVLSTTYGAGDGSTTFNLPNLKGRVPVGRDASQTEFDTLGETGGSKTSALGVSNLPAHTHTASSSSTTTLSNGTLVVRQEGGGDAKLTANSSYGPYNTYTIGASTSTSTSVSGGGNGTATGDAFSNLAPYIALNFIIRF
jgi:microcystin-dependent protein